ncbi:DUF2634 domain-containing protein [Brevibacillus laterosporus]|uniref:DUF2634 domain-containing protein n=1 Tax=Brevibacillus laterosporus TaxID=1465 RepID=UPI003D1F97A4
MFPVFEEDREVKEEKETTPWAFKMDWSTRQLIKGADGRHVKTSNYAEYLEEIAKKILHTKRFQYKIYTDRVGVDFFEHIGELPKNVPLAIIRREVEDALEAHSEIEGAEVTDINQKENRVAFTVQIEGVRGKTKAVIDIWGKR